MSTVSSKYTVMDGTVKNVKQWLLISEMSLCNGRNI